MYRDEQTFPVIFEYFIGENDMTKVIPPLHLKINTYTHMLELAYHQNAGMLLKIECHFVVQANLKDKRGL